MRILLDTHLLIWVLTEDSRIKAKTWRELEDPQHTLFFSPVSIWEIAIKARLRRADFNYRPEEVARAAISSGLNELLINSAAAAIVADLPLHHRDPFDHLLIAQAIFETAYLYTEDEILPRYSSLVKLLS